jgi:FAD/FMN-containing dehydrogenase
MPYTAVNQMLDAAYPRGAFNYWKSNFLAELRDDAIDAIADAYDRCSSTMSDLVLEHFHGAVTRVGVGDTAFPHRTVGENFLVLAQWTTPSDGDRCKAWARETYAMMQPYFSKARYVNYLDDDETGDPVAAAYGPNYERLRRLKAKYDPTNFFYLNQNIRPLS